MRLGTRQNEAVRQVARSLFLDRFHEHGINMAREVGMTPSNLSRFLASKQGTTVFNARKIAHLAGISVSEFGIDVPPDSRTSRRLTVGSLPGWAEVERQARQLYRHVPEGAWIEAREYSAPHPPKVLTVEYVAHLALAADAALSALPEPIRLQFVWKFVPLLGADCDDKQVHYVLTRGSYSVDGMNVGGSPAIWVVSGVVALHGAAHGAQRLTDRLSHFSL